MRGTQETATILSRSDDLDDGEILSLSSFFKGLETAW
jgi:hypothetical protein